MSAADVPLIMSVKVAGETFAGTDRITVWLLPASMLKGEAGDVVAPAGNPESVTVTESANPFWPVIDTAKFASGPPALTVSAVGDDPMLKSGWGLTVRARLAEWVSAADAPLTVRVKVPAETVAGTDRVTVWLLPAAMVKGEAGDVVAPAGNPRSVTFTESLNPFCPVIDTEKVELEPPATTVSVDGDDTMLKSLAGGGGVELDPVLQPAKLNNQINTRSPELSVVG